MERTTVTRNIQPLEKAGLLRVARTPDDARARVLTLTSTGERLIQSAYVRWERAQKRVREAVGASRIDALRAQLTDVLDLAPIPGADDR
jgi:DNA-binding MarR family transcriptional regulator